LLARAVSCVSPFIQLQLICLYLDHISLQTINRNACFILRDRSRITAAAYTPPPFHQNSQGHDPPPFLLSILSGTTPVIPDSPPPYNADAIIERSIEQKMSA